MVIKQDATTCSIATTTCSVSVCSSFHHQPPKRKVCQTSVFLSKKAPNVIFVIVLSHWTQTLANQHGPDSPLFFCCAFVLFFLVLPFFCCGAAQCCNLVLVCPCSVDPLCCCHGQMGQTKLMPGQRSKSHGWRSCGRAVIAELSPTVRAWVRTLLLPPHQLSFYEISFLSFPSSSSFLTS